MRALCDAALIALLLVCGLPWGAAPRARAQGDLAGQVVAQVNSLRASLGLAAWTVDPILMAVAQNHANWMVATGQYGHTGEGGSTPQDRALAAGYAGSVAENWVAGPGMTPAGAVEWWRNSGIHYATLTSSAQHVGVGVVGGSRGTVYVLVAGRPSPPRRPVAAGEAAPEEEEDEDWPVVVPITRAEPNENGRIVHVVQQGQTAWAIAAVYKVDLDEMLRINNLVRPVVLKPGDEVIVRLGEGESPPPTPTPPTEYTIQEGQTIWEVAVTHGLTVDQLLGFNGLTREDVILPGTVLRLVPSEPGAESPPPEDAASVTATDESPAAQPPTDASTNAPPAASPTVTPLPSPTLLLMPTITPAYSPTPSPEPPTGSPVAPTGTSPSTLATANARPASSASDDEGTDEMLMLSLGVLGAVWVVVGGIGLAGYVTKRRR